MRVIAGIIAVCELGNVHVLRRPTRLQLEEERVRQVTVCSRAPDVVVPALLEARERVRSDGKLDGLVAGLRSFLVRAAAKAAATVEERWGISPHRVVEETLPDVEDVLWVLDDVVPLVGPRDPIEFVREVGRCRR